MVFFRIYKTGQREKERITVERAVCKVELM
jgi:hypothetical protein